MAVKIEKETIIGGLAAAVARQGNNPAQSEKMSGAPGY